MRRSARFFQIPKNVSEPELFKKMIQVSLAVHVAVLLFFGLKAAIFPDEPLDLDAAIKVDMVGLPDKVAHLPEKYAEEKKTAPAPKADEKTKPEAKKKPAPVVLKPKKSDLKNAINEIREMEQEDRRKKAVEELAQEMNAEKVKEEREAVVAKLLKGNIVSPGSALHGLTKSQFNDYVGKIQSHVHDHWNLPEWLQNDSLKATVIVYLDYRGVVIKRVLQKTSGDSRFDKYVLAAVDSSSPFPVPPPKFVDLVRVEGIALGFPQ